MAKVLKYIWCNEVKDGYDWDSIEDYLRGLGILLDSKWHERATLGDDAVILKGAATEEQWASVDLPSIRVRDTLQAARDYPLEAAEKRAEEREWRQRNPEAYQYQVYRLRVEEAIERTQWLHMEIAETLEQVQPGASRGLWTVTSYGLDSIEVSFVDPSRSRITGSVSFPISMLGKTE